MLKIVLAVKHHQDGIGLNLDLRSPKRRATLGHEQLNSTWIREEICGLHQNVCRTQRRRSQGHCGRLSRRSWRHLRRIDRELVTTGGCWFGSPYCRQGGMSQSKLTDLGNHTPGTICPRTTFARRGRTFSNRRCFNQCWTRCAVELGREVLPVVW